jgi:hypothetical protein
MDDPDAPAIQKTVPHKLIVRESTSTANA